MCAKASETFGEMYRCMFQFGLNRTPSPSPRSLDARARDRDDYSQELALEVWGAIQRAPDLHPGYYVRVMQLRRLELVRAHALESAHRVRGAISHEGVSASPEGQVAARHALRRLAREMPAPAFDQLMEIAAHSCGLADSRLTRQRRHVLKAAPRDLARKILKEAPNGSETD